MPASVAVPLPLSVNAMPDGRAPVIEIAGAGEPVVVIVKLLPTEPMLNAAALALVIAGA